MTRTVFPKLARMDADVSGIIAGQMIWKPGDTDRYVKEGRRSNLLYYMLSGEREYYIDSKPAFRLKADECIFIPATTCYVSKVVDCEFSEGVYIDFNLRLDGELLYVDEPLKVIHDAVKFRDSFIGIAGAGYEKLYAKSKLLSIIASIAKSDEESYFTGGEFSSIYSAILAIENNPERPMDVASLARLCCMSETGFRDKFKRYTGGLTPIEYRNRLRIERADELMSTSGISIGRISDILGFYDQAHFYRVYKKIRGHKPSERDQ